MNVVLLAFHYPPDPAVGSLRPAKVARALRLAGHDVTVITARLPGETPGTRSAEPGLTVTAIEPQRNPREWYAAAKARRSPAEPGSPNAGSAAKEASYVIPKRVPLWKRTIFSLLLLPDHRQGFIHPAIRAAKKLLRRPGSVLYTSGPPFSVHLAGWWLAHKRVPWIAEFRDPWTDNPWKPWHVRTGFSDAAERWMERRVLARAAAVVAVTGGIERSFRAKLPPGTDHVVTVRNGIDTLAPASNDRRRHGGSFRIVHIGSFYYGRDPRAFLGALAAMRQRLSLGSDAIRVDLVGNCRWYAGASVEQAVTQAGLGDWVQFHDWVPHARAQEFVQAADLLLLLAQNQPDQIPNKLYEYLGVRRPILAVADQQGESSAMLSQVGGHFVVHENSVPQIEAALEAAIRGEFPPRAADAEATLEHWSSSVQMGNLVTLMENLAR